MGRHSADSLHEKGLPPLPSTPGKLPTSALPWAQSLLTPTSPVLWAFGQVPTPRMGRGQVRKAWGVLWKTKATKHTATSFCPLFSKQNCLVFGPPRRPHSAVLRVPPGHLLEPFHVCPEQRATQQHLGSSERKSAEALTPSNRAQRTRSCEPQPSGVPGGLRLPSVWKAITAIHP